MKKNILIVVVVILLMAISAGVTYLVMDNNKEECPTCDVSKTEENSTDGVKLTNIKENGDTITEVFNITLNGKTKTLLVKFTYSESDDGSAQIIEGKYNNQTLIKTGVMGSWLEESNTWNKSYPKKQLFNINIVKGNLNESNFQIIKGTDNKNYLLMRVTTYATLLYGQMSEVYAQEIYILNEDLELIKIADNEACSGEYAMLLYTTAAQTFELGSNGNIWYNSIEEDKYNVCSGNPYEICESRLKIEDNKIYYLVPHLDKDNYDYIEERIYTINNNKTEYETIQKYENIYGSVGGIC